MQYINCSLEDLTTRYPLVSVGTTLAERIAQILRQLMAIKPGEKASSDSIESFCTMIMEADRDALCAKLILPIGMRVDIREEIAAYLRVYTFETFVSVNGDLALVNMPLHHFNGEMIAFAGPTDAEVACYGPVVLRGNDVDALLVRLALNEMHGEDVALSYLSAVKAWHDACEETGKSEDEEADELLMAPVSETLSETMDAFVAVLMNENRHLLDDWMLLLLIKEEVLLPT